MSALRELDEKGNGETKELEDKKTRIGVEEQKTEPTRKLRRKQSGNKWPSK